MNDLVCVQIAHAVCNLSGPVEEKTDREFDVATKHLVELTIRAVLHHNAETRSLRAHTPEMDTQHDITQICHEMFRESKQVSDQGLAHLKEMTLVWLSFRRCLMSVSLMSRTFFTATCS